MYSSELEIGRLYAYREKRGAGNTMLKVKLLDILVSRKGKLRVRFEDGPYPGLEDYVSTASSCARGASDGRSFATRNAPRALGST